MTTTTQLKKTQQDLTKAMEGFDIHCVRQVKGAQKKNLSSRELDVAQRIPEQQTHNW